MLIPVGRYQLRAPVNLLRKYYIGEKYGFDCVLVVDAWQVGLSIQVAGNLTHIVLLFFFAAQFV